MKRATLLRPWLVAPLLAATALLASACDGGSSPTSPDDPPTMNAGFASFRLAGSYNGNVSVGGGDTLVFCRTNAGWADLWIRFARQAAGDGGSGPHLDIDLCNLGDGGTFDPKDPQSTSCGGGKTWDIFWHVDGRTFANSTISPSCIFNASRDGNTLRGSFSCVSMPELAGSGTLDVLDGMFECVMT